MSAPSLRRSVLGNRRRLAGAALLLGLGEFADAFAISFWEGAAVASALFLAGVLWIRGGGIGGPILVATLCVFELQSFPTWKRTGDCTLRVLGARHCISPDHLSGRRVDALAMLLGVRPPPVDPVHRH